MLRYVLATIAALSLGTGAPQHVTQKNKTFSESSVTIQPAEPLAFINDDAVVHNVYSATPGFAFNLRTQSPGKTTQIKFDKEGSVDVRCAIHPSMKMTIVVKR